MRYVYKSKKKKTMKEIINSALFFFFELDLGDLECTGSRVRPR